MKKRIGIIGLLFILGVYVAAAEPRLPEEAPKTLYPLKQCVAVQDIAPYIDEVEIVTLEATPRSLIGEMNKMVLRPDGAFVLLTHTGIYVFDKTGKFLFPVGRIGEGPGEYVRASDLCLSADGRSILVLTAYRQVLRYQADDGSEIFFFVHSHLHKRYKGKVTFAPEITKGRYPWIWDTHTGERYRIELQDGSYTLEMSPADSRLIVFDKTKKGPMWNPLPVSGNDTQTLTGSVECAGERKTFKIYGEKTELLKFRAPAPISRTVQQLTMKLRIDGFRDAEHTIALRGMMIPAARNEIKIDGDLADWPAETAPVTLDFRNARTLLPWSKADQQIRAELRFAWSPAALYCAVTVHRDAFHPEERFGKMAIWRGDSLQFGIDTMKNATPETKGFQSDDFEYLIGEFQKKPLVWRLAASSVTWDSFAKEIGEIDDVKLAIRHQPGKTIYEMAFSPVAVSPFRLIAGSSG